MGWYERVVFNRILEGALDVPEVHEERRLTLAPATGRILEIGLGTGLNLPHYPEPIRAVVSCGPEPELDPRARERAAARSLAVEHVPGDVRALPFAAGEFDTVVCTFILCSVRDPANGARELARVLKADGRIVFLEHVIARAGARRVAQRVLDPVSRLINCGCSITADTTATLADAFEIAELVRRPVAAMPWTHRDLIRGVGHRLTAPSNGPSPRPAG